MADPRMQPLAADHEAPRPPLHEPCGQTPIPSKSVQRSKTVRNLGSAGSKVRGFFKKKDAADAGMARESRSFSNASQTSVHYPVEATYEASQPPSIKAPSYSDADVITEDGPLEHPTTSMATTAPPSSAAQSHSAPGPGPAPGPVLTVAPAPETTPVPSSAPGPVQDAPAQALSTSQEDDEAAQQAEMERMQKEIERIKEDIERAKKETHEDEKRKKQLEEKLAEVKAGVEREKEEYSMIEAKLRQLEGEFRVTDDDLSTIQATFSSQIKYTIQRIVMQHAKGTNREQAVKLFVEKWPSLGITSEVEPKRINQLVEKLIHGHIKTRIFDVPIYPGLAVNDDYVTMSNWLNQHKSPIAVRLRRQLAAFVAKSLDRSQRVKSEDGKNDEKSDTVEAMENERTAIVETIFADLARIYPQDNEKLRNKIEGLVDTALRLVLAIRGQKATCEVVQYEDSAMVPFNSKTMEAVNISGSSQGVDGVVHFWISPYLKMTDDEVSHGDTPHDDEGDTGYGFLEKGKVVLQANKENTPS